jgi:hypothetical protein
LSVGKGVHGATSFFPRGYSFPWGSAKTAGFSVATNRGAC